ncbi:MAG: PilZ domain-containing protein [Ruminococcus sp.]|jgi:hypothetical protein|nr:PilZ domain-containing protein [Ruminococcus sp.]
MIPLPFDYKNSICEIRTLGNEFLETAVLDKITGDYIQLKSRAADLPIMRTNSQIKLCIFNSKLGFRVVLGSVYTSTYEFMKVAEVISVTDRDRRKFFRVGIDLGASAYYTRENSIEFTKKVSIRIKDLSLSGLRFEMKPHPLVGDEFLVELTLGGDVFNCLCRVVRRIDPTEEALIAARKLPKEKQPHTEFGCEFVFDEALDTDPLLSFLFKQQSYQMRKARSRRT